MSDISHYLRFECGGPIPTFGNPSGGPDMTEEEVQAEFAALDAAAAAPREVSGEAAPTVQIGVDGQPLRPHRERGTAEIELVRVQEKLRQAEAEIRRLTEENERLEKDNADLIKFWSKKDYV